MYVYVCRPTAENLVPIRLDIEIDGQRFRDAFTWNPSGIFLDVYSCSSLVNKIQLLCEL